MNRTIMLFSIVAVAAACWCAQAKAAVVMSQGGVVAGLSISGKADGSTPPLNSSNPTHPNSIYHPPGYVETDSDFLAAPVNLVPPPITFSASVYHEYENYNDATNTVVPYAYATMDVSGFCSPNPDDANFDIAVEMTIGLGRLVDGVFDPTHVTAADIPWLIDNDVPGYFGYVGASYDIELLLDVDSECAICVPTALLDNLEVWDSIDEVWNPYGGPTCLPDGLYRLDLFGDCGGIFEPFLWDPVTQEFSEGASGTFTVNVSAVPEPSSIALGLMGAGALAGLIARRRRSGRAQLN